jgi:hypothetical protein
MARISLSRLQKIRQRLGPISFYDYSNLSLVDAHRALGLDVKIQVHKILQHKLDFMGFDTYLNRLHQAQLCYRHLASLKESAGIPGILRDAIGIYLDCLQAWAELDHMRGVGSLVDDQVVTLLDMALFLQNDNTGCQTGIFRNSDGSVILWHTEEDYEGETGTRLDCLRIAVFRADSGAIVYAFIYPDLLPGPAFNWRSDGYIQAVDTLLIHPFESREGAALVNAASWIVLFTRPELDVEQVLQALIPYYDGYALNSVVAAEEKVEASVCEFLGRRVIPYQLAHESGSFLFQVNIFSQNRRKAYRNQERVSPESRRALINRIRRTRNAVQRHNLTTSTVENSRHYFWQLMTSREGGEWAYANDDVKAHFLGRLSATELDIYLGGGAAMDGVPPQVVLKYRGG